MEDKIEKKSIKIYVRSKEKIYLYYKKEIQLFENEEIENILENFFEENDIDSEKRTINIIFHFSYFLFDKIGEKSNIKNMLKKHSYIKENLYFNYIENKYINIFLEKNIINEWKRYLKKYKYMINSIKIDFDCLFNAFKDEDCEILQLGELESIRLKIESGKIVDFEFLELKIDDVQNTEEFDFGDMIVVELEKEDLEKIFEGEELFEKPNFIKESFDLKKIFSKIDFQNVDELKKVNAIDIVMILMIFSIFWGSHYFIPIDKKKNENKKLQQKIKEDENKYLKIKNEKVEDFSEELKLLGEIDNSIKRKEYYSLIKMLIDNSVLGVGYTQIKYSEKKWSIQGEISDFEQFEKFENNLIKKYKKSELGYIKDNDLATIFEYNITE